MNAGTRNLILHANPLKLRFYFIYVYTIIFSRISAWTRQVVFVLNNVKHEFSFL